MNRIQRITIVIALAISVQFAVAQDKLNFALRLEAGSSFLSTFDASQNITQTVDGEKQELTQEMFMSWIYDVQSRDKSGEMDIRLTYKRIKVLQDYGEQVSEYDSENPPSFLDPSMRGLATLPGTVLNLRLDTRGKVLKLRGVDEMLDKMITAMQLPDSPNKENIIADLRKQFGMEAMKQSIEQATLFYPEKAVSVGQTWVQKVNLSSSLPMNIESNYSLQSRIDGISSISVKSDIKADTSNALRMGQLSLIYDISGNQDGLLKVDEKTGLPISSELNSSYSGNVIVAGVADDDKQSWPISAVGSVKATFQKQ